MMPAPPPRLEPASRPLPRVNGGVRRARAESRLARAWAGMARCHWCAHRCGANRPAGERGPCRAGIACHCFSAQVESGDELELVPTYAVALGGCDLRCAFCVTGAESWNPGSGVPLDVPAVAREAAEAVARGARSVMILGGEPTIHLPHVLELVAALPEEARLVWKTNGQATGAARRLLEGLFDIWVVDYKFGNDACARRLAGAHGYARTVRENLRWAAAHTELIVRHLLMPGHVECCWRPVASWLARALPGVKVSLRTGFWPAWPAGPRPELGRPISESETAAAGQIAQDHGLRLVP